MVQNRKKYAWVHMKKKRQIWTGYNNKMIFFFHSALSGLLPPLHHGNCYLQLPLHPGTWGSMSVVPGLFPPSSGGHRVSQHLSSAWRPKGYGYCCCYPHSWRMAIYACFHLWHCSRHYLKRREWGSTEHCSTERGCILFSWKMVSRLVLFLAILGWENILGRGDLEWVLFPCHLEWDLGPT